MNSSKNMPFYLIAVGLFILLKFGFKFADTNDLTFLLKPTNDVVELLTGSSSTFVQSNGYFHPELNIVIDKSCSGFNFFLICFMMLCFLALKHFNSIKLKSFSMVLAFIGAYVITILVNGSRIFASILFEGSNLPFSQHPNTHESIGVITNLTFLIIIYITIERTLNNRKLHAKLT